MMAGLDFLVVEMVKTIWQTTTKTKAGEIGKIETTHYMSLDTILLLLILIVLIARR